MLWAVFFQESWHRTSSHYTYHWGTLDNPPSLLEEGRPMFKVRELNEPGGSGTTLLGQGHKALGNSVFGVLRCPIWFPVQRTSTILHAASHCDPDDSALMWTWISTSPRCLSVDDGEATLQRINPRIPPTWRALQVGLPTLCLPNACLAMLRTTLMRLWSSQHSTTKAYYSGYKITAQIITS